MNTDEIKYADKLAALYAAHLASAMGAAHETGHSCGPEADFIAKMQAMMQKQAIEQALVTLVRGVEVLGSFVDQYLSANGGVLPEGSEELTTLLEVARDFVPPTDEEQVTGDPVDLPDGVQIIQM